MHVIYVDDEKPALNNFRLTVAPFLDIEILELFQQGEAALEWAEAHPVDVAFLDMEMPRLHGLELAERLKAINRNIRIVFVTAYDRYALDAFQVGAIGYIMKPYLRSDLRRELDKAVLVRDVPEHRVEIRTIPNFCISVDGTPLRLSREKPLELLALLVDQGERGITTGEGIAFLWPDRPADSKTRALLRVTFKRLADALEEAGIRDIILSRDNWRAICTNRVECDLYRILAGDKQAAKLYNGQYLQEYSWGEERNAQLQSLLQDRMD